MSPFKNLHHIAALSVFVYGSLIHAQEVVDTQNVSFASSASLTQQQMKQAGINDTVANNIEVALNFERSNWANVSVDDDPFYRLSSSNATDAPPGSLLRLQINVNTSQYTLPPNTALSRIIFQTQSLNGSMIPASAYILWPYNPRIEPDGYPVIGWAHGTSGGFGDCAPSHVRNLWYQFAAPYTLALQGYVVVAPDYAGLGVTHDAYGNLIRHQYTANPAHANDLFYSVQAAQSAFASLSKRFVLMGHSQGGGVAWGAAQRQVEQPVDGYLGAVAGSPLTDTHALWETAEGLRGEGSLLIANGLQDVFPGFDPGTILTPAGLKLYDLVTEIQGCQSVYLEGFTDPALYHPGWYDNEHARSFFNLTSNGNKPIGGPMLVLQGGADEIVPPQITEHAVNATCSSYPNSQLQYYTYANATHVPVMFASQRTWLDWIADRFADKPLDAGCQTERVESARPYSEYQVDPNWFLEYATVAYQVA